MQKFTFCTRATCSKGLHVQLPQLLHLGNRNLTVAEDWKMYYLGMLDRLRGTLFQFPPSPGWWRVEHVERMFTHKVGTLKNYNWRLTFARNGEQRVEVWANCKAEKIVDATRLGGPVNVKFRGVKYTVLAPVAVDATTRGYGMKYKNKKYERKRRKNVV